MAYTKITPIKTNTHLQQSIDYITNPGKTEEMLYVSSYMCDYRYAAQDFKEIWSQAIHKGNNLAHHIIQSYAPDDDITPEKAIEIAQELMRRMYPNYQYVIAVHQDTEHLHAHIIVNSVDFENYRKLHSNIYTLREMRQISDDLCRENDLSVIPLDSRKKKVILMETIDHCIEKANDFDEFIGLMQEAGYEVKIGKYLSFKGKGDERFRRSANIGNAYSEISIRQRLNGIEVRRGKKRIYDDKTIRISNKKRVKYAIDDALKVCSSYDELINTLAANGMKIKQGVHLSMRVPVAKKFVRTEKIGAEYTEEMLRLYFDDRAEYERIKADASSAKVEKLAKNSEYNRYAAIKNINIQIRMYNMLNEYGIKSLDELSERKAELENQEKTFNTNIKQLETQNEQKKSVIRYIRAYWRLKPVHEEYKNISSPAAKELYGVEHSRELWEYDKATEIMNASKLPDGTLPKAETLNKEIKAAEQLISEFTSQKTAVRSELAKLKVLKENINILSADLTTIDEPAGTDEPTRKPKHISR